MYTVSGGPCSGYQVGSPSGEPTIWHFAQMWDAILVRDSLNRGEWVACSQPLA